MAGRDLDKALAIDIIVPAYELHHLIAATPRLASAASSPPLLPSLCAAPKGRGIVSDIARFQFPYTRVPLWVSAPDAFPIIGALSHADVSEDDGKAGAVSFFSRALAARQFLTLGRGFSKVLHRYKAPLLQDFAAIVLVISAVAVQNLWGLVALGLAGASY